jgi:competence ComEA-like helix-hairpin-helix protein
MKRTTQAIGLAYLLILTFGCNDPWKAQELVYLNADENAQNNGPNNARCSPDTASISQNWTKDSVYTFLTKQLGVSVAHASELGESKASIYRQVQEELPKLARGDPQSAHSQNQQKSEAGAKFKNDTVNSCIDLNEANLDELCKLKGIGPKKAEKIIELREKRKFRAHRDLTRIKGIGPKTVKKLSPQLCPITK